VVNRSTYIFTCSVIARPSITVLSHTEARIQRSLPTRSRDRLRAVGNSCTVLSYRIPLVGFARPSIVRYIKPGLGRKSAWVPRGCPTTGALLPLEFPTQADLRRHGGRAYCRRRRRQSSMYATAATKAPTKSIDPGSGHTANTRPRSRTPAAVGDGNTAPSSGGPSQSPALGGQDA
jgi:hypothetical protein